MARARVVPGAWEGVSQPAARARPGDRRRRATAAVSLPLIRGGPCVDRRRSREVKRFILDHIDTVEELEVLLHLRASPDRAFTADDVSRDLRTDPRSAAARLQDLVADGLVAAEADGTWRYGPRTADLDRIAGALAEAYTTRRVAVIELIATRPSENVRSFAEAFRIHRRGKKDGDGDG